MGDDVICIDSDDDDEDDATDAGRTLGARASGRRASGRGYWRQRRRAQRERRKRDSVGSAGAALVALSDGLRLAGSEISLGAALEHSVAQRVHRLVAEFERQEPLPLADRQEGWRQVLRFLLMLQAIGPDERKHPGGARNGRQGPNKRRQSGQRYQLTVIDILVDYIRFRCETVTVRQPVPTPGVLLDECNRIVGNLFAIFGGNAELVTMTLLRTPPERRYTVLLYPVFEAILTGGPTFGDERARCEIPTYVRMLLCFKRWRSLVTGRVDRAVIDCRAGQFLPARCPTLQAASDVPYLRLLPTVPAAWRPNETRYLLANDLFALDQCVAQFFRHHRRTSAAGDERQLSNIARPAAGARLSAMALSSNYINVALLAELIEQKGQLWARAFPVSLTSGLKGERGSEPEEKKEVMVDMGSRLDLSLLAQEADSIVESLRLIFRQRPDFIELTLVRVPVCPGRAPLLAPVFAAFLATPPNPVPPATFASSTGLAIYRTNDVETYARLILCYAKWKALYRAPDDGRSEPSEWARIDAMALSQLPFDFPRALCPRDALLRKVFPPVCPAPNHTATRMLLRTLPARADLQELCTEFIAAHRDGMRLAEVRSAHRNEHPRLTCSAAYEPMASSMDRTDRKHPAGGVGASASVQPTSLAPAIDARRRAEMKPIIIPDSGHGDETSASETGPPACAVDRDERMPPSDVPSHPPPATGCADAERDRNASNTPPVGESVADGGGPAAVPLWPPTFVECFLNTPPATPQQEVVTEPAEEDQRRSALVKKPVPDAASWCRLKGTVRSIGRRKTRTSVDTVAIRRALKRMFEGAGGSGAVGIGSWWSFADILAVQIPFSLDVRWCSSIINVPTTPASSSAVDTHLTPDGRVSRRTAHITRNNRSRHSPDGRGRSSQDDALLLELIGCLDAADNGMPSGCVDFAIPPDNPGRVERSHSNAVGDRASPSVFEWPVDTSPLFASDSDRFVHLVTELGPVSWPIV